MKLFLNRKGLGILLIVLLLIALPILVVQLKERKDTRQRASETGHDVQVISEIRSYTVTIQSKEKLIGLLNSWAVFGKAYPAPLLTTGTATLPLRKIIIHLASASSDATLPKKDGRILLPPVGYWSKGIFTADVLDYYLYIRPELLETTLGPKGIYIQNQFIPYIYGISHPTSTKEELNQKRKAIKDIMIKIWNDNTQFFSVEK